MPDVDRIEELRTAERQLQAAQLASDVAELDRLIDDRLIFTGPGGKLHSKADDLRMHSTGEQKITRVEEEDLSVLVVGDTGVTCFLGTLEGRLSGMQFTARIRYTRTWIHDTRGWRILAVHVSDAGLPIPNVRDGLQERVGLILTDWLETHHRLADTETPVALTHPHRPAHRVTPRPR